jgi:RNA polymerase sigma-70 factor (ECF subfamily)
VTVDDQDLAAAAAGGDRQALAALVERYRSYAYALAYKIALHADDALDIAQNAFVRVVERIGTFNGHGTFRSWLSTIVVREAMSYLRRPTRREAPTEPEALAEVIDARTVEGGRGARGALAGRRPPDAREALDAAQRRQLVEAAMVRLAPQQRAILALRLREDLGPKEIAERLGVPAQQVRSQLHRAIAALRKAIAEEKPKSF